MLTRSISQLCLRLRALFRPHPVERELDDELAYHVERLEEEYLAAGLSTLEARTKARREIGAIDVRKEECRDARWLALIDSIRQDVGYAWRALRKSPAFSSVAILSLAIGIGANTTIFSFVNAILLTPLRYPDSERLAVLHEQSLDAHSTGRIAGRSSASRRRDSASARSSRTC